MLPDITKAALVKRQRSVTLKDSATNLLSKMAAKMEEKMQSTSDYVNLFQEKVKCKQTKIKTMLYYYFTHLLLKLTRLY